MHIKVLVAELCEAALPREFKLTLSATPLELQGSDFIPLAPPLLGLRLHRKGSKIEVEATLCARLQSPCARCLTEAVTDFTVTAKEEWPLCGSNEGADDFGASTFLEDAGLMVNLAEYGAVLLVEHLPARVLCVSNCQGLCPVCGANRNEAQCGCEQHNVDPRLAALGRLLPDKGGVRDGTTEKKDI